MVHVKPFVNIDKRWIAGMYEQLGLMDELFPMTASCIGDNADSKYYTEPCGKCFWCYEKKWASFGCYDGGKNQMHEDFGMNVRRWYIIDTSTYYKIVNKSEREIYFNQKKRRDIENFKLVTDEMFFFDFSDLKIIRCSHHR